MSKTWGEGAGQQHGGDDDAARASSAHDDQDRRRRKISLSESALHLLDPTDDSHVPAAHLSDDGALPTWAYEATRGHETNRKPTRERRVSRRGVLSAGLFGAGALALLGGGGYAVYEGMTPRYLDAPVPSDPDIQVAYPSGSTGTAGAASDAGGAEGAVQAPVGPDGKRSVPVKDAENPGDDTADDAGWLDDGEAGGTAQPGSGAANGSGSGSDAGISHMAVSGMDPMSVFIPAIGAYSRVRGSAEFKSSRYANFQGIAVPSNPKRSVWFSGGAPLVGGDAGTTFIAGHVAHNGVWGAFRRLYRLRGGEVVWTKDEGSRTQRWQVVRIMTTKHTDFPQDFWSPFGERRLVIATCGGKAHRGYYSQNIFAIAVPVNG